MNSGLDDYPRNNKGNSYNFVPGGHIDAQSWMYFFASVMKNLASLIGDSEKE
jgi:hypothetical protein